jgi:hypothetical protein
MRWILASLGLLTVIVVFSLAALDQKNVVWVGDAPHCPHCRMTVIDFATVCNKCDRAFDWKSHEDPCTACLSPRDARYYLHKYEDNEATFDAALLNAGLAEELVAGFVEYAAGLKSGACGFCGGSGDWLAPGHQERTTGEGGITELYPVMVDSMKGRCPVCFGTGRCILCDGDRMVEEGRETAGRDLRRLLKQWNGIDPLRDEHSADARFQLIDRYVNGHRGRGEIAGLPSFDQGEDEHLDRARKRLKFVKGLLSALP